MDLAPARRRPRRPGDAGGKGASLARLTRAGLPVPAGFHVTTRAFRERSLDGVLEAFRELGGPVAVRSSATAEDLPDLADPEGLLESGIPAVVGCGNATTRIATGDRIRVDGARGTVKRVH